MDKVKLDCMLDVLQAREKGQISKTNVLKMDKKVNETIRKILDKDIPKYELTLYDKIRNSAQQLPIPNSMGLHQIQDPSDLAHWKGLPIDVKKHEVKRMHAFLFKTTSEFDPVRENF